MEKRTKTINNLRRLALLRFQGKQKTRIFIRVFFLVFWIINILFFAGEVSYSFFVVGWSVSITQSRNSNTEVNWHRDVPKRAFQWQASSPSQEEHFAGASFGLIFSTSGNMIFFASMSRLLSLQLFSVHGTIGRSSVSPVLVYHSHT